MEPGPSPATFQTLMGRIGCCLLLLWAASAGAEDRVADARQRRTGEVKALAKAAGLTYPVGEVYLRAFKKEKVLELWAGEAHQPLKLVKSYPFCAASGDLGPKRREGDLQVPEGFYELQSFNPQSNFHLSLQVSYPNASDRVLSDPKKPGGAIYIHGNCASIGCIALQDEPIEEVYLFALDAKVRRIPIHIFPQRLDEAGVKEGESSAHAAFWKQLAPGYALFEASRRPPAVKVDAKTGGYAVSAGRAR
jgi:murein L,D-transpeptidase YafK